MPQSNQETLAVSLDLEGHIDIITAGYPCQAFSTASRGRANARDLWPEAYRIIRQVRPNWVLLENVPGKDLAHIERSARDLECEGYAVWTFDIGIEIRNHIRRRVWVMAHAHGNRKPQRPVNEKVAELQATLEKWRDQSEPLDLDDGLPNRMARLKMLGNSLIPIIPELFGHIIKALP